MKHFLSIDQGTTSSRSIIFNSELEKVKDSQKEYDLSYPQDGWVELNPSDILATVEDTICDVLDSDIEIEACGITNQRETTIVWSKKSGKPIYPGIVWQDRRTHELCSQLKSKHEATVNKKTGLLLDPYFSATKIKWILDNVEGARDQAEKGELLFGTVDTYLIYMLSNEKNHLTDVTNASRTLLYNIHTQEWDDDLLKIFEIPKNMMPKVLSCDGKFGTLSRKNKNISIRGVIGDQQAAMVGQNCFKNGDMKSTYGTGCFLMVNTEEKPIAIKEGLLTTIAYKLDNKVHYAIEGSIYSCGNIIKWLRDKMHFFNRSSDSENFINKNGDSRNVLFLPAFNGLGAPFWDSDVRGGFYGITQDSSKEDMITACFNSIAYQTKEITLILNKYQIEINQLLIDGGMVENETFCQMLANTIENTVIKPLNAESTALGACKVAMIAVGEKNNFTSEKKKIYKPIEGSFRQNEFEIWKSYILKSL